MLRVDPGEAAGMSFVRRLLACSCGECTLKRPVEVFWPVASMPYRRWFSIGLSREMETKRTESETSKPPFTANGGETDDIGDVGVGQLMVATSSSAVGSIFLAQSARLSLNLACTQGVESYWDFQDQLLGGKKLGRKKNSSLFF